MASSKGVGIGLSFDDKLEGFISGETMGEVFEDESLVTFPLL